ncbi:DUF747-domain-containing protein [Gonapodya prolifera JEL478]|uniref:DUF747-domain-containing protein n=1 Tax=Gonapodya prolifera (strain JEL478) TaxID=1344416 RepID=A0A139ADT8_GONPJ|nr:DUF747-domain-containing protein [Gonapodya prolifera JEL478]|eukprot:KXS14605.1 DUF747-domain-containing protein [Gonapodya prolifera JEL478]
MVDAVGTDDVQIVPSQENHRVEGDISVVPVNVEQASLKTDDSDNALGALPDEDGEHSDSLFTVEEHDDLCVEMEGPPPEILPPDEQSQRPPLANDFLARYDQQDLPSPDTSCLLSDTSLFAPDDDPTDQLVPRFVIRRKSSISVWSTDANSQSQPTETYQTPRKRSRVHTSQEATNGQIPPRPPTPSMRSMTPSPAPTMQFWSAPTTRSSSKIFPHPSSDSTASLPAKAVIRHITSTVFRPQLTPRNPNLHARRVRRFLKAPLELERFLWLGYTICLDAFLWCFTALPVRWCISTAQTAAWMVRSVVLPRGRAGKFLPDTTQRADLVELALVIAAVTMLLWVDSSAVYHSVRAQSAVKLYVIFNVLEVLDKLFQSLGHDVLDSLFSASTLGGGPPQDGIEPAHEAGDTGAESPSTEPNMLGFLGLFVVGIIYVFLHSLSLFAATTTLNVAVNSHSNALLTLLLSNQFVEVKGAVWKKMDADGVWQIACGDVVERFQLSVYLVIIASRNYLELTGVGTTGTFSATSSSNTWWLALWPFRDPRATASQITSFAKSALQSALKLDVTSLPPAIARSATWLASAIVDLIPLASSGIAAIAGSATLHLVASVSLPALVVLSSEVLVDWLKHAFVTKFNGIEPEVYSRFAGGLCGELCATHQSSSKGSTERNHERPHADTRGKETWRVFEDSNGGGEVQPSDASPAVARRIGFVPLPLFCLVLRVSIQMLHMVGYLSEPLGDGDEASAVSSTPSWRWVPIVIIAWVLLWGAKVVVALGLAEYASRKTNKTPTQQLPEVVSNIYPAPVGKIKV